MTEPTERDREIFAAAKDRALQRAADFGHQFGDGSVSEIWDQEILIAISAAREEERARCAKIVEHAADTWWVNFSPDAGDLRSMVQEIMGEPPAGRGDA
jgi:hypothetical protein